MSAPRSQVMTLAGVVGQGDARTSFDPHVASASRPRPPSPATPPWCAASTALTLIARFDAGSLRYLGGTISGAKAARRRPIAWSVRRRGALACARRETNCGCARRRRRRVGVLACSISPRVRRSSAHVTVATAFNSRDGNGSRRSESAAQIERLGRYSVTGALRGAGAGALAARASRGDVERGTIAAARTTYRGSSGAPSDDGDDARVTRTGHRAAAAVRVRHSSRAPARVLPLSRRVLFLVRIILGVLLVVSEEQSHHPRRRLGRYPSSGLVRRAGALGSDPRHLRRERRQRVVVAIRQRLRLQRRQHVVERARRDGRGNVRFGTRFGTRFVGSAPGSSAPALRSSPGQACASSAARSRVAPWGSPSTRSASSRAASSGAAMTATASKAFSTAHASASRISRMSRASASTAVGYTHAMRRISGPSGASRGNRDSAHAVARSNAPSAVGSKHRTSASAEAGSGGAGARRAWRPGEGRTPRKRRPRRSTWCPRATTTPERPTGKRRCVRGRATRARRARQPPRARGARPKWSSPRSRAFVCPGGVDRSSCARRVRLEMGVRAARTSSVVRRKSSEVRS